MYDGFKVFISAGLIAPMIEDINIDRESSITLLAIAFLCLIVGIILDGIYDRMGNNT